MSPNVKKIVELMGKMGVMSQPIRETYQDIVNDMIDQLTEEELEELSKKTLGSYVKKASMDAADKAYDSGQGKGLERDKKGRSKVAGASRRLKNIDKAADKLSK